VSDAKNELEERKKAQMERMKKFLKKMRVASMIRSLKGMERLAEGRCEIGRE
jgi:hypothetical protein